MPTDCEAYQKDVFTVYGNSKVEVNNSSGTTFRIEQNGLLRSRQIKIDTDNWPDYVFDNNYELLSIDETEDFIKINGHLPGVPSAEEVEENGMDVEEINKILLLKIEELTLRLIAQEKRLNILETKK